MNRAQEFETQDLFQPNPPDIRLIGTDALPALDSLPERSVQAVITSPPYWGLRDYGLPPSVWTPVEYVPMTGLPPIQVPAGMRGDDWADCDHDWGEWTERHETREGVTAGKTRTSDRCYGEASRRFNGAHHTHIHGQFCQRCGAWRGCLGLEPDPHLYIGHLVQVLRAIRRVLRDDGTVWLNLGDSFTSGNRKHRNRDLTSKNETRTPHTYPPTPSGLKPKDLVGIPWRAAFALQADGWYLRSDIVWAKGVSFARNECGNAMPESVTDRPVRGHEFLFLLAKSEHYYYDHYAVQEAAVAKLQRRLTPRHSARDQVMRTDKVYPYRLMDEPARAQSRRNLRDVWRLNTRPFKGAHFAVFPPDLVRPALRAATPEIGVCAVCGAPWHRRTRRDAMVAQDPCRPDPRTGGVFSTQGWDRTGMTHQQLSIWLAEHPEEHEGWVSGCSCGARTTPALVLDPFAGAGTTGVVAREEGRAAILIEPKGDYREIIASRLGLARP